MPSLAGYTFGNCQRSISSIGIKDAVRAFIGCEWVFKMIDELMDELMMEDLQLLKTN